MSSFQYTFQGTIKPKANFNADTVAEELENAMKGKGCDKMKIIQLIIHINNAQRQMVLTPYQRKFDKELIPELKKELSGDFEDVIIGLMATPTKYDAIQMMDAMKGLGTRESTLIDVLCSRNNDELLAIKREFEQEYGVPLDERIVADTSGDFKTLLTALAQGQRNTSYNVDVSRAREDVKKLFGNKALKEKPDKDLWVNMFSRANFWQLKRVFSEYISMTGETISDGIKRVFSGDAEVAYLALVAFTENKERYFAKQLYAAMEGLGTRDKDLIRVIISRSEIDLAAIHEQFDKMYKKPLIDWLKSECSGAYRDALISIVNGN